MGEAMNQLPVKVIVAPPSESLYSVVKREVGNAAAEVLREMPLRDERGAPTIGGLLWAAKELQVGAEEMNSRHVRTGEHGHDQLRLARTLAATADTLLRIGCSRAQANTAPDEFCLALFDSLVALAAAICSEDGPIDNRPETLEVMYARLNTARELREVVGVAAALLADARGEAPPGAWRGVSHQDAPNRGSASDVANRLQATVDAALVYILPVTVVGRAYRVEVCDDPAQPNVCDMRVHVRIQG